MLENLIKHKLNTFFQHRVDYFQSIHGSPKPKRDWVKEIIELNKYELNECLLIGDSVNDKEAAQFARIKFKFFSHA